MSSILDRLRRTAERTGNDKTGKAWRLLAEQSADTIAGLRAKLADLRSNADAQAKSLDEEVRQWRKQAALVEADRAAVCTERDGLKVKLTEAQGLVEAELAQRVARQRAERRASETQRLLEALVFAYERGGELPLHELAQHELVQRALRFQAVESNTILALQMALREARRYVAVVYAFQSGPAGDFAGGILARIDEALAGQAVAHISWPRAAVPVRQMLESAAGPDVG